MAASKKNKKSEFILKLFVSGASPNSVKAIQNIKTICDFHLQEKYKLEIVDVYQDSGVAEKEQIVALPLLIKKFPLPERKLVGDMSNTQKVLLGLGLIN